MYYLLHYTCSTCFGCYLHPSQEHKLQSTAVGTRDCYGVLEAGKSIGAGCGWDTLTFTAHAVSVGVSQLQTALFKDPVRTAL
jgi:hypothetical protein